MTEEQLRSALIEAQDFILSQLPKTEWDYEFTPKFHRKMKRLIELEMHPIRYYLIRAVAVLLAIICLSGGMLLGFSEEARAKVIWWINEFISENEYRYQSNKDMVIDVSGYTFESVISDGYTRLERIEMENSVDEIYVGKNGEMLTFSAIGSSQEELYVLSDESGQTERIDLEGTEMDLYISEKQGESNMIVWEGKNGVLFSIQGKINKEQLIEIARMMRKLEN